MKIAGVQMDIQLANPENNLRQMEAYMRESRTQGAQLTIFPECALTGYCFNSLEEALPFAENIPGPSTMRMQELCKELGGFVLYGLLEKEADQLYNSVALVSADGVVGSYRKIHLPFLGIDRFTTFGDRPFEVLDAGSLKIGINICYDAGFPESARVLTLLGADLIVIPTNWPPGAETMAQYAVNARAMENCVYCAAVNRIGKERGFPFIGLSRICAPNGETISLCEGTEETILYAKIDPEIARQKRLVRRPGLHIIDRFADRRPEMYEELVKPHSLKKPGRE